MNIENIFNDKLSVRIWTKFFNQVTRILSQVTKEQKEEIILELQGHVLESFQHDAAESEPDRLMNAFDKLGDPEEFLRPIAAEKLLATGARTLNLSTILHGLYYNMFSSTKRLVLSLVFAIGYVLLFIFFSATIAKLFVPEFGLYVHTNGGFSLGMMSPDARLASHEILGIWMVPLGIVMSVALYIALTKLLGVLMKSAK